MTSHEHLENYDYNDNDKMKFRHGRPELKKKREDKPTRLYPAFSSGRIDDSSLGLKLSNKQRKYDNIKLHSNGGKPTNNACIHVTLRYG